MISRAKLKKLEERVVMVKRAKGNYQYIFGSHVEFEEAKQRGLVDPDPSKHCLILDDLE